MTHEQPYCCILRGYQDRKSLGILLREKITPCCVVNKLWCAGDYNMNLMDQLNAEPDLNMVPCCNELNAGRLCTIDWRSEGMPSLEQRQCDARTP